MGEKTFTFRGIKYPIEAKTTALIIIDMQNDFLHDNGYFGRRAKELGNDTRFMKAAIPPVIKLSQAMRAIGVPVIYCQTMWEPDYADCGIPPHPDKDWQEKTYLAKGSWGAQIIEELTPQKGDYVVEAKCYSKFPYTPLELILRNKGIKTLVFTGVTGSGCVESTVRDATSLGYHCIMTGDGTGSRNRQIHEAALERVAFSFAAVMTCEEVEKLLRES